MNFLSKLLRRLFPRDGQLRIAVYMDGHAQIQEYCGYADRWQTYVGDIPLQAGHRNHFDSFEQAKSAYDLILKELDKQSFHNPIVRTYP